MRDTYTLKQTPQLAECLQVMDTHIDSDKVPVKEKKKNTDPSSTAFTNVTVS